MKRIIPSLAALLLSILLASCADSMQKHHQDFYVFGTLMGVTLWAEDDRQAHKAFSTLQERFQLMHSEWHAWEPGLLVSVNQAFSSGEAIEASEDIVAMVRRSQQVEAASGGRFNPAIGAFI